MGKRSADGLVLSQSMEKPLSKWKKRNGSLGVCDPNGMKAELLQAEDAACQRKRALLPCPPNTCSAQFGNDETPVSAEMADASTHAPALFLCPRQTSPINLHSLLLSPDAASESFWTQSSSKPLGEARAGMPGEPSIGEKLLGGP